jgi:hypothetical protein
MARASYEIVSVLPDDKGGDIITIRDLCHGMTITNDAEAVVKEVLNFMQTRIDNGRPFKIHYFDSEGRKDELCHDGLQFTGFMAVDPLPGA